ncbi:hypothetical protein Hamer_G025200, partial [Homarus americanus]
NSFIALFLTENDVDLLLSSESTRKLKSAKFEVVVPPQLQARKSIVVKRLDKVITEEASEQQLVSDIEHRTQWAKVEEVVKLPRLPSMLKIRFTEIAMAQKANPGGLCLSYYNVNSSQVEQENSSPYSKLELLPIFTHATDCPNKDTKHCRMREQGHTFRECKTKIPPNA